MGPQARLSLEPLKLADLFVVEVKRVSEQIAAMARDVTILRQELARRRRRSRMVSNDTMSPAWQRWGTVPVLLVDRRRWGGRQKDRGQ
jgi:hypothetical protein